MKLRYCVWVSMLALGLPGLRLKNSAAAGAQLNPPQAQITVLYDAFGQNSPRRVVSIARKHHSRLRDGTTTVRHLRLWIFGSAWPEATFQLIDKNTEIAPDIHLLTLVADKPGTFELREVSLAINTSRRADPSSSVVHIRVSIELSNRRARSTHTFTSSSGLHLVVTLDPEIERIVIALHDRFKEDDIAPGQSTGEPAFVALQRAIGDHDVYAGLGTTLKLTSSATVVQGH